MAKKSVCSLCNRPYIMWRVAPKSGKRTLIRGPKPGESKAGWCAGYCEGLMLDMILLVDQVIDFVDDVKEARRCRLWETKFRESIKKGFEFMVPDLIAFGRLQEKRR